MAEATVVEPGATRRHAAPTDTTVVFKFGGTSVADADRIGRVAGLVCGEDRPVVVVVSALGGITDRLVRAAHSVREGPADLEDVLTELRERHLDVLEDLCPAGPDRERVTREIEAVLDRLRSTAASWTAPRAGGAGSDAVDELVDAMASAGEDLSAPLVACAIRGSGRDARVVDARTVVRTNASFGRARPDDNAIRDLASRHLAPLAVAGTVPVVQGFVGATGDGRTTTLGRGGSDLTAALLASALGAGSVHIWTDVDGILSGDPRTVEHPMILPEIGFEEAVELSYFGAKVIHPGAAKHAVSRGLDVWIRNTFRPDGPGTVILADHPGAAEIAAVAHKPRVALIKVRSHPSAMPYGFLARVFDVLARHELPVDLVATSHSSTAFTLDESEELDAVRTELSAFAEVVVQHDLATVTVVGRGMMAQPGIDALVFWAVEKTPVHLISQASDVSLSFVVDEAEAAALVRRLHLSLIEFREEEVREWIE